MADLLQNKVVITDLSRFKKVYDLSGNERVGLPSGHISREELRQIPKGSSFELNGKRYYILACDIHDHVLTGLRRNTQIVFPKDAGYIVMRMDIAPGKRIGEAGTGSGAMTAIFSRLVGQEGRVYTYEHDIGLVNHARRNLRLDEGDTNIVIHHKPIDEGVEEQDLDAFFLDVREPWKVIWPVYGSLKPGGHLCILVPTTNQVSRTLQFLLSYDIWVTEIAEIMLRTYKNVPARLRPSDRMVGHTAFLIFGRKLIPGSFQQYQKITSYEEDEDMEMERMDPEEGVKT